MKELAGHKGLQKLHVGYTVLTDAGLKELAGLAQLQELTLIGTRVTDAGVAALQKGLPKCRIVR
jgi:hypothetical protein